ncbi:hypothetical protein L0665_06005 [Methanogenium marinum]|uniref:Uncharacterized protein n=1 Tax=Methanogenium marinum TaxID=348610 RepID=A0A9Q4KT30_9EURY|nr:hypothetical protein [Methanogenium marinum]MDE4908161.1 hypothetical protein [Methanogenium marinum]
MASGGECRLEIPVNDTVSCPDWIPDRLSGVVSPETATFDDIDLDSVSLPSVNDALTPESEPHTKTIVGFLLIAGVILVCLGIVITVASIIFLLVSGL